MNEKTNINWLITINLIPYEKYCKMRKNSKIDLACFIYKYAKIGKNK